MEDTIALEYYRRNAEAENALAFPFSLFVWTEEGRSVLVVNKWRGGYRVKRWMLAECDPGCRLPPFREQIMPPGVPLLNVATVLPEATLLDYQIPQGLRGPIMAPRNHRCQLKYEKDLDDYLNASRHQMRRRWWLMEAFHGVYGDAGRFSMPPHSKRTVSPEGCIAGIPKVEETWRAWCRHMIDFPLSRVAPEIVFAEAYADGVAPKIRQILESRRKM